MTTTVIMKTKGEERMAEKVLRAEDGGNLLASVFNPLSFDQCCVVDSRKDSGFWLFVSGSGATSNIKRRTSNIEHQTPCLASEENEDGN